MNLESNQLIYVYCVTGTPPAQGEAFLNDNIYVIENNGLYITVKNVWNKEYSKENLKINISNEAWLDKNARLHISVIENIMETTTVVPFNFGTVYTSKESLTEFVKKYNHDLRDALMRLENKQEWALKIYCDKNKVLNNINLLSINIADIDLQIKKSSPGKAYILGKKKNEIIEKEITVIYNSISKLIFTRLHELSEEYKLHTLLTNEISGRSDDMILYVSYFIKKENIDNFIYQADAFMTEYENISLDIDLTGPWPPYTFLNISN